MKSAPPFQPPQEHSQYYTVSLRWGVRLGLSGRKLLGSKAFSPCVPGKNEGSFVFQEQLLWEGGNLNSKEGSLRRELLPVLKVSPLWEVQSSLHTSKPTLKCFYVLLDCLKWSTINHAISGAWFVWAHVTYMPPQTVQQLDNQKPEQICEWVLISTPASQVSLRMSGMVLSYLNFISVLCRL